MKSAYQAYCTCICTLLVFLMEKVCYNAKNINNWSIYSFESDAYHLIVIVRINKEPYLEQDEDQSQFIQHT